MAASAHGPPVDYVSLAEFLSSMGSPVRLEILHRLRFPHSLSELRVRPYKKGHGEQDRAIARQTVQAHLDRLVEMGLVNVTTTQRSGRDVPEYVVNPGRLYALTEDLRTLSTLYAGLGGDSDQTGTIGEFVQPGTQKGPRLVLVHGVWEGKTYSLGREISKDDAWVIGRGEENPIALSYDPYVSTRNTQIVRKRGRFILRDLESKNRTRVNWTTLPSGGEHVLRPGDVIGVGRSLLSFVPE